MDLVGSKSSTVHKKEEIANDEINKGVFLFSKVVFFAYLGGQGVVINYRSLFSKHLGLTKTQGGFIWSVDRLIGVFSPPILGMISDKTRRPRDVIAIIFTIGAIFLSLMVFVPIQHSKAGVRCEDKDFYPIVYHARSGNYMSSNNNTNYNNGSHNSTNPNNTSDKQGAKQCFRFNDGDDGNNLTSSLICVVVVDNKPRGTRELTMRHGVRVEEGMGEMSSFQDRCTSNSTYFLHRHNSENNNRKGASQSYDCGGDGDCEEVDLVMGVRDATAPPVTSCVCSTDEVEKWQRYDRTFWIFMMMNGVTSVAVLSAQGLIDAFIIDQLPMSKRHHFGYQRMWGSIGYGLLVIAGGFFKDMIDAEYPDASQTTNISYAPIFMSSALCYFLLVVTVKCTKPSEQETKPKESQFRLADVKTLFLNPSIVVFVIFVSAIGFSLGVGENYAFVLMAEKLDASGTVMGLSIGLSTVLDVIMYLASTRLLKVLGTNPIMISGLLLLSLKLLLYTFCTASWQYIIVEQIRGLTWGVTWTAVCNHSARMCPRTLNATMMGIVSMGAWGLGYGLSSLVGGILYDKIGGDGMFRVSCAASASVAIIYGLYIIVFRNKTLVYLGGDEPECIDKVIVEDVETVMEARARVPTEEDEIPIKTKLDVEDVNNNA